MKINDMTKGQLLNELIKLRQLIAKLEKSETEHKLVEEALIKNEQFLANIFESIQDGISVLDTNHTIQLVNGVMKKWYAENVPLEGKKCYEAYHNRNKPCKFCPTTRCLKSGQIEKNIVPGLAGSTAEWLELHSYPIKDENSGKVTGVVEFVRDITERKRAEEELKSSEDRLKILFEFAPDAYYLNDLKGNFIDGNIAAEKLMGYKKEELIGKSFLKLKLLPAGQIPIAAALLAKNMLGQPTGPNELFLNRKDGSQVPVEIRTFPVNINGQTLVLGIARDITERRWREEEAQRRAAQAALVYKVGQRVSGELELEAVLPEIVSAVRDAFDYHNVMLDMVDEKTGSMVVQCIVGAYADIFPKGKLMLPIGEGMTGYAAATGKTQVSGDVSQNPHYVQDVEETKSELSVPIKNGKKILGVLDIQSNELDAFDEIDVASMETLSTQIAVAIENAQLYEKAQSEITERRLAEDKIKASLHEKEVLLQEVHHRVKNNLQIISSLLNLQSRHIKDEQVLEIFKNSQNRVRSMGFIHEKLYKTKDFARVDFNEYVRSLTNHLFSSYEINKEAIKLNTNIKDVFLDINTAIPCGLIINELVSNSMKYGFPDGKKGEIKIAMLPLNKNKVELIVSDNGVGIPEEVDFRNTESLGLHLVTILAEGQLHGDIKLEREGGTSFHIGFKVKK